MSTRPFQAEVSQLLELIIHSLYSHKEIFLRELVSNASDALDKLRYLSVSDEAYKAVTFDPRIDLSFDTEAKTLTIADSGVGMTEEELAENLGTIARSGTRRFMEALASDARKDANLIGRFGVGFYSAFMVASEVDVLTRKAGQDRAWLWKSDGKGEFSIDPAEREGHGTTIVLHMNEEGAEYLSRWKIEDVVKKYSNHVAWPIFLAYMEEERDDKGQPKGEPVRKESRVNEANALWTRPKSELKNEDYLAFYKAFTGEDEAPLLTMHTKAEGTIEYTTLLYVPAKAPFDLYYADYKPGVKLYVRRVFITDDEKELLPPWLRFVRGVIDSEDLPLNVSREILQQNRVMATIRNAAVKKILTELKAMAEADKEKYGRFACEFNRPLKEGLYQDFANRDAILELVRWKSSSVEGWTSLADYKSRMKDGQKAIYYLAGDSEERLKRSPLLEMYRKEGIEVLICPDEIDEVVVPSIGRYADLELKAANRAGSEDELGKEAPKVDEKEALSAAEKLKKALGDRVKDVRLSKRLDSSPACIVVDAEDPSFQLQRMLKAMGRGAEGVEAKPILEINGAHPLVARIAASQDELFVADSGAVLLGQALLMEGAKLEDPAGFVAGLNRLISAS